MTTVLYTQPRGGGDPVEEFPATIREYTYRLNRPGRIEFTLPLDDPKTVRANIEAGVHEVVVERNGAVVWVGPILTVPSEPASGDMSFAGEGLMSYLRRWHIRSDKTFSSSTDDQTAIAWWLISQHQAQAGGDFGLTDATTASGRKRDQTYYRHEQKNVFDAFVQLSERADGFDFEFTTARTLATHYPRKGTRRTDVIFDTRNISRFDRRRDATRQASQILAAGAGEGTDMLAADVQSSAAVAKYGLTQARYTNKDVKLASTLRDHAERLLDELADVPNLLSITVSADNPPLFSYNLGDEVRVKWPSTYDPVDEYQRIIGIDVHPATKTRDEEAVLHLVPL